MSAAIFWMEYNSSSFSHGIEYNLENGCLHAVVSIMYELLQNNLLIKNTPLTTEMFEL